MKKYERALLTQWLETKLKRNLTTEELENIDAWAEWGFDIGSIKLAFNVAWSLNHKASFRYVQVQILQPWYCENLKTFEQVRTFLEII